MGKRELDVEGKELFDVRTTDIICLLDLDHTEDLWGKKKNQNVHLRQFLLEKHWIERKRARCLAAMSWYKLLTASARLRSRNSLYMLCVPDRES
jgi:hypothetical protein